MFFFSTHFLETQLDHASCSSSNKLESCSTVLWILPPFHTFSRLLLFISKLEKYVFFISNFILFHQSPKHVDSIILVASSQTFQDSYHVTPTLDREFKMKFASVQTSSTSTVLSKCFRLRFLTLFSTT